MSLKFRLILVFNLLSVILFAQKEQVTLKVRNAKPIRNFECKQPSFFEVVNGKFNADISSVNGYLFEITSVSTKSLKCKTTLNQGQFKAILIDNQNERTFVSDQRSKGILKINCLPDGSYELIYTGDIYLEKQKVSVSANLVGKVAQSRDIKTNTNEKK